MKPLEERSSWPPQPSSRTALELKLHFNKNEKDAFIDFRLPRRKRKKEKKNLVNNKERKK